MTTANPMNTARSAMAAYAAGINMYASNTANAQTTAAKRLKPSFNAQVTGGSSGSSGINVKANNMISENGILQPSDSSTDLGIAGNGFFVVKRNTGDSSCLFTRKGDFTQSESGLLTNSNGDLLMGWATNRSGTPTAANITNIASLVPVNVNTVSGVATATQSCTLKINLDETAAVGTVHTTPITFYDNLGAGHDVMFKWTRAGNLTQMLWNLDVTAVDGSTITKDTAGGGAYAGLQVLFNSDGTVNTWDNTAATGLAAGAPPPNMFVTWTGAAGTTAAPIVPNLGTSGALGTATLGGIQCFAGSSNNFFVTQDGVPYGNYNGVAIDEDGIVTAQFDNGEAIPIYQIPLANFASANSLDEVSGNTYQQTIQSGTYVLNSANNNGLGKVEAGTLEASNTDLATEFVEIMILNRAYNSNAKLLSVADGMLETVQNILR